MKKIIAVLLILCIAFSFIGCKGKKQNQNNSSKPNDNLLVDTDDTNSSVASQNDITDNNDNNLSSNAIINNKDDNQTENINKPQNSTSVSSKDKLEVLFNSVNLSPRKTNDEELDKLVEKLFKDVLKNKKTFKQKVLACYNYIVDNTIFETPLIFFGEEKYASECDYYIVEYAKNLLTNKKASFEGYSSTLVVLLRAIGFDAYMVGGSIIKDDGTKSTHTWCVVKINDKEYLFDPLLEQTNTKGKHFYFCKTYEQLKDLYTIDDTSVFTIQNFKNFVFATCENIGHKWKKATCLSPKTCAVCGIIEGEKSEHSWSAKSCNDFKVCSICGEKSEEKLGHDFAPATCLSPKKCKRCGITEGTVTDHNYTEKLFDATCTEEGRLFHICSICTISYYETIPIKDHIYNEWITTLKATTETDGEKKRSCKNCTAFETATINKLTMEDIKAGILTLINNERKKASLTPLEYYSTGQSAADKRASELLSSFSHTRPNESKFYTVFGEYGIAYQSSAESIAKDLTTPEDVIAQILASPDDKKNILGNYQSIMLGYEGKNWVILFISQ